MKSMQNIDCMAGNPDDTIPFALNLDKNNNNIEFNSNYVIYGNQQVNLNLLV
jgi:hypothetical protein